MIIDRKRRFKRRERREQEIGPFARIRKKFCRFCKEKAAQIDYKNLSVLEKLISERGRILSRRVTGTCARHQRKVAIAIKRARFLSLLPYTR